jgi:sugar phosphate isomerase/epimerase
MRELHEIGYDTLDFPFDGLQNEGYILKGDDWQARVDRLANEAAKLGVTFAQCHLPFPKGPGWAEDKDFRKPGYREYFDECVRRTYIAASMLGVKYATAHPLSDTAMLADMDHQLQINHDYYDPFIELGISQGVGTAYENMRCKMPDLPWPYRFCCNVDDQIALIDSYNDTMVGACWDTGHGNAQMQNQRVALNRLSYRLRNLHINDNEYGMRDEHLIPGDGTLDFARCFHLLKQIGYKGEFVLEAHHQSVDAKDEERDGILRRLYASAVSLKSACFD